MSGKTKKLVNQESKENYGDEVAEGATEILQINDKFDGADDEFEEARVEENAFDAARAVESMARARSQRAGNLAGNATGTAKDPKKDEEEENTAGNRKHPSRNPVGGSHD